MRNGMFGMKRKISFLPVMLMLAILVATAVFAEDSPAATWELVGIWTNPAYEDSDRYLGKIVYRADGIWEGYDRISDTSPVVKGTYVVDDEWTEKGIHWFAVRAISGDIAGYEINKLSDNGNTYESIFSTISYPSSLEFARISPSDFHTIRFRQ